jgi:hypothetical protein
MNLVGLGDSATQLLANFASQLVSLGVDVPNLQYVNAGELAWDGDSLTLNLGSIAQGKPGSAVATSYVSPDTITTSATMYVQLLRTVDTVGIQGQRVNTPSKTRLQKEGVVSFNDAGALMQAAINLKAKNIPVQLGIDFSIGSVMPVGPMGGMAANRLELNVILGTQ